MGEREAKLRRQRRQAFREFDKMLAWLVLLAGLYLVIWKPEVNSEDFQADLLGTILTGSGVVALAIFSTRPIEED